MGGDSYQRRSIHGRKQKLESAWNYLCICINASFKWVVEDNCLSEKDVRFVRHEWLGWHKKNISGLPPQNYC
jgi:hypothetical protein